MLDREAIYAYGECKVKTRVFIANIIARKILGTTETCMEDEKLNVIVTTTVRVLECIKGIKDSVDNHYNSDTKAAYKRRSNYRSYDDLYMRYTGIFGGFGDPMDMEIAMACLFKNHEEALFTDEAYTKLIRRLMTKIEENPMDYSYFPYAKSLLGDVDNES